MTLEEAQEINKTVNRELEWRDDSEVWKVLEFWPTTKQMDTQKYEDCDGYQIRKYGKMRDGGVPIKDLLLVLCRHQPTNQGHMVLFWYDQGPIDPLVMDNLYTEMYRLSQRKDLELFEGFNENNRCRFKS